WRRATFAISAVCVHFDPLAARRKWRPPRRSLRRPGGAAGRAKACQRHPGHLAYSVPFGNQPGSGPAACPLTAGGWPRSASFSRSTGRITVVRAVWFAVAAWFMLAAVRPVAAENNTLTDEEIANGWILLFDGETLFGWAATSQADWKAADGMISVTSGEPGFLRTTSQFGDFELK